MGTDGRHLSLRLRQNDAYIRAVAFGKGEWAESLKDPEASFDFAFEPMINDFRGRKSAEVKLIDFRPIRMSDLRSLWPQPSNPQRIGPQRLAEHILRVNPSNRFQSLSPAEYKTHTVYPVTGKHFPGLRTDALRRHQSRHSWPRSLPRSRPSPRIKFFSSR